MLTSSSPFSPEVSEYMQLNGYKLMDDNKDISFLSFRRGDTCVTFYQDRIEKRIISPNKTVVSRLMKSFKGFDGKDIFQLMLILHVLDAVDLKEVKQRVQQESKKHFKAVIDDIISTIPS